MSEHLVNNQFSDHFDFFWKLIDSKNNFTFARYADGEILLMKGQEVGSFTQASMVDKWQSPNFLTKVGSQLIETLNHTEDNYYYAISSVSDNINDYNFLKNNIKQSQDKLTFVNLWINANYKKTINKIISNKREVILICNENARVDNFPFNVIDIKSFPNDCVNFWEENGNAYIIQLLESVKSYNNTLFYISCGPVSEIIIHNLYKQNPNNTYIDIGSCIDQFIHKKITRPYMVDESIYSTMISKF